MNEEPKSVFGQVDQDAMIARLEQAAADEAETTFFDRALEQADPSAAAVFAAGVEALGGLAAPAVGASVRPTVAVPRAPDEPVRLSGPLADDPRAARAFILFGPRAVHRVS